MPKRSTIASALVVLATAGLAVLAPSAARASDGPSCEQGGATPQRNIYYFDCEEYAPGATYLTWSGAPITHGQGTSSITGTCVGGSLPYYITVKWTIAGVGYSGQTQFTCRGGGPV